VIRADRRFAALVALFGAVVGCNSIDGAAADRTRLEGRVPAGLGRVLEVSIQGTDAATTSDLVTALRSEFEGRDLFDRIEVASAEPNTRRAASRLDLQLLSTEAGEIFDHWKITDGYVVRFDMRVSLHDPAGRTVLEGEVSGVAVDAVSDLDLLPPERRDDMRVAALFDATGKLSRALRRAADSRAKDARDGLARITLPPGVGPVQLAVLGFDDEKTARRMRGPLLADHLAAALIDLGPDVAVLTRDEVERALDADPQARTPLFDAGQTRIEPIAREVTARLLVVGRVVSNGGRVNADVRVLDRTGKVLLSHQAAAEGLGALRIVAVELARVIGQSLVEAPPG
jgi:hypothetical protein